MFRVWPKHHRPHVRSNTTSFLVFRLALIWGQAAFFAQAQPTPKTAPRLDLQAIVATKSEQSDSQRLNQLFQSEWKYQMKLHPEAATYYGYPGQNGRWSDHSLAAIELDKKEAPLLLEVLQSIDRGALIANEQLSYDLFERNLRERIEGHQFSPEFLTVNQMGGVQLDAPQILAMMPRASVADYENIFTRLQGLPLWIDQTIAVLREGLAQGITPPQITLRNVAEQIRSQIVVEPQQSPLLRHFLDFPAFIPAGEQERLRSQATSVYLAEIKPAWQRLLDFFNSTYYPQSTTNTGLSKLPKGQDWYAFNARVHTTTSLTPRQIHDIGLSEVKRIRGEMRKIIQQLQFEGTFAEFLTFLRTDDRFFYAHAEDLITGYRDICKRADPELARIFGTLPRLPYGVMPIPSYSEKTQTTAYYEPGAISVGRAGFFFANTYNLRSRPRWEMEALTLHEAVPGHHLQLAIAQEMTGQPDFRRFGEYTAFIEGWGLYAESLGEELGFYKDPYMKFGQLTYEMWRSIRLVVDTGMHSLGWSRQRAIDYFTENAGKTEHDIAVEVDRYLVWPGQALAYKIGQLKIRELRTLAEKELGQKFDLRKFHDAVLLQGALPLTALEAQVKAFIKSQQTPQP